MIKNKTQRTQRRLNEHKEKLIVPFVISIVPFVVKPFFNVSPILLLIFGSLFFENLNAQLFFKTQNSELKVESESKQVYRFPWAGGMNSCQFGEIDLNLDGIYDLFVFDGHGNRIMPFINSGTPGTIDYDFAPEFIHNFPDMTDWVIFADYNADGKPDIFTKSPNLPGIVVYKNTSVDQLEFTLEVYPYLTSFQGGGYVNILVTEVDYPGISDIDNDGDLDILTFWGLGSFVEMHKNLSVEKYGISDSLDFEKTSNCWGYFAENDESNDLYLDTCVGTGFYESGKDRHTGSTFLMLDLDADNDKDLLLGDVDYPNLIHLTNGGTTEESIITSTDTLFPSYDKPVNLFSMPVAAFIDVNNDEKNDLVVSPFDAGMTTSQNYRSVWLYLNGNGNDSPEFQFEQDDFLQNDMIDVGTGAYPVLEDFNGDGLPDLFISNYGYYLYSDYGAGNVLHSYYRSGVSLYINSGTQSQPAFTRLTHNFNNLWDDNLIGIFLTFGDLDGDDDKDMILGKKEGDLWYFENLAGPGQPMEFASPVQSFQQIDVGAYCAPQLFDLDDDGLQDLIIGEENGNLNYYRNTGTAANPDFSFITDSLGKVNVTNYQLSYTGYSTPCFFKSFQNETNLVVGSEQGKLFYYKNIDDNLSGTFEENDSIFLIIDDEPFEFMNGIRTASAISDLNNDGYFDLLIGNYSGGLNYYSGQTPPPASGVQNLTQPTPDFNLFPNPANQNLYIEIDAGIQFEQVSVSLFNLLSQLVYREYYSSGGMISIPLNSFKPGLYFCKVSFGPSGACSFKRFVISR